MKYLVMARGPAGIRRHLIVLATSHEDAYRQAAAWGFIVLSTERYMPLAEGEKEKGAA